MTETVELLDLHTSWDTWERLRRWQRLSVPRSRKLVTHLVTQTLDTSTHKNSDHGRGPSSFPPFLEYRNTSYAQIC